MNKQQEVIDKNSLADIEFRVKWQSLEGTHVDASLVMVNFWRDLLPEEIFESLMGSEPGETKTFGFAPGQLIPEYNPENQYRLKRSDFNEAFAKPAFGRFYPKGLLRGLANIFPQNVAPTRCVGVDADTVIMDMNHPLAGYEIDLSASVHKIYQKPFDRGGKCRELTESIASGPGMQARYKGKPTDFYIPGAFRRQDERSDRIFYETPRMVNHIDDRAIRTISGIYGGFITPGITVLDLMSSLNSHLPDEALPEKMVGLGMNAEEMEENTQLDEFVIHDLNERPSLPFDDNSFDMVICTASVEYLVSPAETFRDTARVLKPGGMLIHTFSNRWFPPKTIELWTQLHEFERPGLVMDYFLQSDEFVNLTTFSSRGWDRPETDKYYPDMTESDPVFAVWGWKK
ncbi:MAG: methyltransferase domain-containing protein [Thermodesulfobacteriota bacterium]